MINQKEKEKEKKRVKSTIHRKLILFVLKITFEFKVEILKCSRKLFMLRHGKKCSYL